MTKTLYIHTVLIFILIFRFSRIKTNSPSSWILYDVGFWCQNNNSV